MDFFIILTILIVRINFIFAKCLETNTFDYIIIGSGSSGAVVATRLSENEKNSVLLLEAGGEPIFVSTVPLIAFKALGSEMDWNYTTVPQKHCCSAFKKRTINAYRGKALGGTSSLNFMTYTRGNKMDYDTWAAQGNPGWDYKSIFKYFLKLEDYRADITEDNAKYHHKGGPMTVSIPTFKTVYAKVFLEAGVEIGERLVDYNAEHQTGFMYPPVTTKDGERCSTYRCYLKPVMHRPNLHVLSHAMVTKIILDDEKKAVGVDYERESSKCTAKARKEIILSAGVFNSPQLLMLSGIGPEKTLKRFGIEVKVNLEGVGQNLQDHVIVAATTYTVNESNTYNSVRYENDKYLDLWKKTRTGPMTDPLSFEGVAYYRSKYTNVTDWPDIEIFFNSDNAIRIFRPFLEPQIRIGIPPDYVDVLTFIPILLRPKSRGYVSIRSKNPYDHPIIDPNYLSHPDDVKVLVEGINLVRHLVATKAFRRYGVDQVLGGLIPNCILHLLNAEAYTECAVKVVSSTGYHPVGTNKMGPSNDPMAVVDNKLKVYGVKGLRIADASIMPNVVAAHPSTACMMIGEKVSDMIKEDDEN